MNGKHWLGSAACRLDPAGYLGRPTALLHMESAEAPFG